MQTVDFNLEKFVNEIVPQELLDEVSIANIGKLKEIYMKGYKAGYEQGIEDLN